MSEAGREVVHISLEDELRKSYLDYAMSVITGRALPDARDGLKPVHRRILFAMEILNNDWNRPYKKSARVVGDVIGRYHPHGDTAVYDALVRMAQPFSLRYPLIEGQGNFGSVDGDPPAAMRYTEVRMQRIASHLLADLDCETVDFSPNYDDSETIPDVMPTRVPNLLINGTDGIAVGLATKIPPHNLTEVVSACLALLDDPGLGVDDLFQHVTGPDFPTGGFIMGRAGILQAYRTGKGRVVMRARTEIEKFGRDRERIVVTEIPYQVNKVRLIEEIAQLVRDKDIVGITGIQDESNKEGVRIVLDLRKGENPEVMLNNLYKRSRLQNNFGINIVALVGGQPRALNLLEMLNIFLQHRREVVLRRSVYLLRQARRRGHELEGLAIALYNIDEIIELIRSSANRAEAHKRLCGRDWRAQWVVDMLEGGEPCIPEDLAEICGLVPAESAGDGAEPMYRLSSVQANAILELRLHRLTALERDELAKRYRKTLEEIADLMEILSSPERLREVIREELIEVRDMYGDERCTEIEEADGDFEEEDLIPREMRVVTISRNGYAKSQELSMYSVQNRGGKGKTAMGLGDDDFVEHLRVVHSHDTLLIFTNQGRVFWLRVFRIPKASRTAKGRPLVNMLQLEKDEAITSVLAVDDFDQDKQVFMAMRSGWVKKTALRSFARPWKRGLRAVTLRDGDALVGSALIEDEDDVMLLSSDGRTMRFRAGAVRSMGRAARGVRGIRLRDGQRLVDVVVPKPGMQLLTVASDGQGKRSELDEYPTKGRGGMGIRGIRLREPSVLAQAVLASAGDEVMLITDTGRLVRTPVESIRIISRNTRGVRIASLKDDEHLIGAVRIAEADVIEASAEVEDGADAAAAEPTDPVASGESDAAGDPAGPGESDAAEDAGAGESD
ncbi:MAG: DNA gyrase subunit A [Gammaproteobacteria bacterium AqS3]|nr:DNA gyrase subunit A [Gammaproteobacteria bacterium AqS3]